MRLVMRSSVDLFGAACRFVWIEVSRMCAGSGRPGPLLWLSKWEGVVGVLSDAFLTGLLDALAGFATCAWPV